MNIVDALVVTLGLDSSGFDQGQKKASDDLGRMSQDAHRAQQSFDSMGNSMSASGRAMQNSMAGLPVLLHEIYGAIVRMTEQVTGVEQMTLSLEDFNGLAEQASKDAREAAGAMGEMGDAANGAAGSINDAGGSIDSAAEKTRRLGEAGSKLGKEFGRSGDQMARSLRGVANEMLGVLALSKGGSFLSGQVVDSVNSQAEVGRQSVNLGMSPRDLKAWESVSELYGGSADEARQTIGGIRQSVYDNIYKGAEVPQWARMLNIQLDNGNGGMRDMEGIIADIFDGLKNLSPDDQSYVSQQLVGLSPSFANMAHKGGANLHGELAAARERSGLTDEGVKNAQEFQRQSIEALQGLEGAWNKFIGENAPALTQALAGITNEFAKFGKEISDSLEDFSNFKNKHASGASPVDQAGDYLGVQIIKVLTGKDDDAAAETVKWMNELYSGKKQAPDGVLYDPSELEGGPTDDRWKDLNYFKRNSLESRIQERDAGGEPSPWKGNPELRAYDEAIWAEHQKRLDWEKKQTELIEKNGYKAVYPSLPEGSQIKTGRLSNHVPIGSFSTQRASETPENPNLLKDMGPVRYEGAQSVDDVAQRILFKESRGRRYDQNGNIKVNKTSGATGEYQILPSTAHDPTLWKRYRVKPARDDSPDEYARVARDLIAAYHRKYNGDSQKIMSAYNAGDGATDSAIAKWGAEWRKHMPGETRGYMDFDPSQKNFGGYPAERLAKQPSREEQQAVAGMQKVMEGVRDAQSMMGKGQHPQSVVSPQLQAQTSPAMSPGVQQAMSNDNRTITSTTATHIDNVNVHVPGGNSKEIAGGIGSALQRHPLINGANYA
ncbi:transglycosylase SLT domain-containing protein [Zymobacter sp. IVIA_12111.31 C1]|uniref:transglycosylase SLT domain-containing protein n=1 Tax=Zymobacter sp. IVIA_12111.31 C1 TaxID=3394854 RepID=UPI0039C169EF